MQRMPMLAEVGRQASTGSGGSTASKRQLLHVRCQHTAHPTPNAPPCPAPSSLHRRHPPTLSSLMDVVKPKILSVIFSGAGSPAE
jgi:hypothetical protein